MLNRVVIANHERGFYFLDGVFQRILDPGVHWVGSLLGRVRVERVSLLDPRVVFPGIELLLDHDGVVGEVEVHRVRDDQRGLVYREGNFVGFLPPGVHVRLRGGVRFEVSLVDVADLELDRGLSRVLQQHPEFPRYVEVFEVPEGHRALFTRDNSLDRVLEPGRYAFWRGVEKLSVVPVDLREQGLDVQGQELMTRDKVSLRLNLAARYKVVDIRTVVSGHRDHRETLYREFQLALREEVNRLDLEDLLTRKEELGETVRERVRPSEESLGVQVTRVGLRDVILPGDMREILNQVIQAEKQAQANMITRREETAATRSLLNTARLLDSNPTLVRLKEMESMERIAEKIGSLSVMGGVDGLVDSLRGMVRLSVPHDPPPERNGT